MKKIIAILAVVFVVSVFSAEAKAYRVEDIPNVQLTNYNRFVSNPDMILSNQAVAEIDARLLTLKNSGKAQVVVVAVSSIGNEDPYDFLQRLLMKWGVGRKDTDDGLGVLLVVDQGAIEIQTGYGVDADLPDALVKRIINNYMIPAFKAKDWDKGMVLGVGAMADVLEGRTPPELEESSGSLIKLISPLAFIFILFLIVYIRGAFYQDRCPKCRGKQKMKRVGSQIVLQNKETKVTHVTYVCPKCGHVVIKEEREDKDNFTGGMIIGGILGGMGGRGGGGFGGGGGGFGGGGFGGGGAGGRF